jgi:hypothetical protein
LPEARKRHRYDVAEPRQQSLYAGQFVARVSDELIKAGPRQRP